MPVGVKNDIEVRCTHSTKFRYYVKCVGLILRPFEKAKALGVPVLFHSDGNLNKAMSHIIAAGFDGLQCVEPAAGMDIAEISAQYGKSLCLMGGIEQTSEGEKAFHLGRVDIFVDNIPKNGNGWVMAWTVMFTGKAKRQKEKLPLKYQDALDALRRDIELNGPVASNWPHYGKLKGKPGFYHCHLNKGKPRYVAVWKVTDKAIHLVEVRYVGTHEKAGYGKIF